MHRVGIIPFELRDTSFAVLFVTSQTRGRLIFPKGRVEPGETHEETCHREGFEEAGVKGVVLGNFPMTVKVSKSANQGLEQIPVSYYPFFVQHLAAKWPEQKERERHWLSPTEATEAMHGDEHHALVQNFVSLQKWILAEAKRQSGKAADNTAQKPEPIS